MPILPEMAPLTLTLPAESLVGVRIPPRDLHNELRRRLAAGLYADGILSGASDCCMASVGKAEFQYMLGERGIAQPLNKADYEQDLANLAAWKAP
jgi:predicted HTH domain antitoxin